MTMVQVYLDRRDWWIGYYRGATHHYVCPLPCLVIRVRRARYARATRSEVAGAAVDQDRALVAVECEDLVAEGHAAIAATDWADRADAFSTQSYLAHLQASLPANRQLVMFHITHLPRPAFAVAAPDGSWTVCVPGVGAARSAHHAETGCVAWDLIQSAGETTPARTTAPLERTHHDRTDDH